MANTKRKPGNRKPITSHPLFPAVVALWFGALFGLGSLAIRPSLIESLVLKTGIDLIIPAAAPPLGVTARILIALVMASAGAALGVSMALRLGRPKTVVRERKRNAANPGAAASREAAMWNQRDVFTDGPARRPISAHEELGDALDAASPLVGRRRSLAVEHEEMPFQPQEFAPLPGGELQIFDVDAIPPAAASPAEEIAPLDLGAFPAPAPVAEAPAAPAPAIFAQPLMQPQPVLDRSAPPVTPAETFAAPLAQPVATPQAPAIAEAPSIFGMVAENGHVPAEFVRAAGFRTSVFETDPTEPLFAERADAAVTAAPPSHQPAPETLSSALMPVAPAAPAPLPPPAGLGISDLSQRLQQSMARRRAVKGDPVAAETAPALPQAIFAAQSEVIPPAADQPAFVPPPPIAIFAAPELDDPAQALAVPPAPIPMPAALRPVTFDGADDDDHGDLAELMPRHLAMPQTAPVAPPLASVQPIEPAALVDGMAEVAADDTGPDESPFASLLTIETPRHDFVRIETPEEPTLAIEPVVIFPGQMASLQPQSMRPFDALVAPAPTLPSVDPAEAELALRSALANLQRISGAA